MTNGSKNKINVISEWAGSIKHIFYVVFLLVAFILVLCNWSAFSGLVSRILRESTEVSIAGYVTFSLKDAKGTTSEEKWIVYYRIKDKVRINKVQLGKKGKENKIDEFVEIEALSHIDLSQGYIGDIKNILYLGSKDLYLHPEDKLRIYTYKQDPNIINENEVVAKSLKSIKKDGKLDYRTKGMFKGDAGEGDRIVIINSNKEILLDLDYWHVLLDKANQRNINTEESATEKNNDS